VRELQNVIERAFITSIDGKRLNLDRGLPETAAPIASPASIAPAFTQSPLAGEDRVLTSSELQDLERANTLRALQAANWKISGAQGAAELLGLKPNTLASRMRSLGIQRPDFPERS
jgi:transcriptional regulator with GAF, ATPase, and Fis domain